MFGRVIKIVFNISYKFIFNIVMGSVLRASVGLNMALIPVMVAFVCHHYEGLSSLGKLCKGALPSFLILLCCSFHCTGIRDRYINNEKDLRGSMTVKAWFLSLCDSWESIRSMIMPMCAVTGTWDDTEEEEKSNSAVWCTWHSSVHWPAQGCYLLQLCKSVMTFV